MTMTYLGIRNLNQCGPNDVVKDIKKRGNKFVGEVVRQHSIKPYVPLKKHKILEMTSYDFMAANPYED